MLDEFIEDIQQAGGATPEDLYNYFPFDADLAYQTYLLNPDSNNINQYVSVIPEGGEFQSQQISTHGGMGEFSLGFNPFILNPMCDILFDEKIAGSLHLTPGQAYEECNNGNHSAVHWDMVLIQRPEWGGGEIWFDGELIRKDGMFLPKDLKGLNRSALKS